MSKDDNKIKQEFVRLIKNNAFVVMEGYVDTAMSEPHMITIKVCDQSIRSRLEKMLKRLLKKGIVAKDDLSPPEVMIQGNIILQESDLKGKRGDMFAWEVGISNYQGSASRLLQQGYVLPEAIKAIYDTSPADWNVIAERSDNLGQAEQKFVNDWISRN